MPRDNGIIAPVALGNYDALFIGGSRVNEATLNADTGRLRVLVSGVPVWTAYEVLLLWAYANSNAPMISCADHPAGFVALFFLVPFIHEVGFYFAHRLMHWTPLYEAAHKLHHRNINPGPWSGMSMHPIEHIVYFPTIALFFLVPSHPIHMINLASRLAPRACAGAMAHRFRKDGCRTGDKHEYILLRALSSP